MFHPYHFQMNLYCFHLLTRPLNRNMVIAIASMTKFFNYWVVFSLNNSSFKTGSLSSLLAFIVVVILAAFRKTT